MCEEFRVYLNCLVNAGRYYLTEQEVRKLLSTPYPNKVFKRFPDNNRANKMLKEWLEKAKISKALTFHGLRHTFAMTAVARGIDIYALKELMGHASIENTLIYAKMLPSKLVSEIKKLD